LSGPYAIEVNDAGDIYVVENYANKVSKFIFSGDDYTQVIVAGGNGEGTELNQLSRPMDLHLDESDNLYVLDTYNHRVVKWLPGAIQGSVVAGGNNNGSDLNQLYYPHAFSVDDSGNIYIADWDNRRIVKWDVNSSEGTILKDENNSNLRGNFIGIHVDNESGNIYASDHYNDIVKKFTPISNNQYSSSVVAGRDNGWGNGSSKIDELRNPRGVNLDNNKNLLVADQENHRIIKVQLNPEIFIEAGETTGTFKINAIDDRVDEDDETIIVEPGENTENVISSLTEKTTLTILNNSITLSQKDDPFLGLSKSSVSWGDFDNDGDKDVAIMGVSNVDGAFNDIYRNNEGSFARMNQNFVNLYDGDLSWVDLNKDGYLDLVVSGYNDTPQINVYISKNNAQLFERSENT
jgi:hypothetical protein